MDPKYIPWIGFHLFIFLALAIDLGVFHRKAHAVKFKEAISWSVAWFVMALLFNAGIYHFKGPQSGLEFLTGYLVEWSLSVDNLFVFLTVFGAFSVAPKHQHRILFWGILGALVMRAIFIFAGIALLQKFHWLMYVFGGFLLITGLRLAFVEKEEDDPRNHWLVRRAKKWLPFTDSMESGHFFTVENGKRLATPLFLVLLVIEMTDLVFAADSIPAILAITRDPFVVYTSNVFAILGLRSLYFALAGLMTLFRYLRYGLAFILVFIGIKMLIADVYKIPIALSLGVIALSLTTSILLSIFISEKRSEELLEQKK